MRGLWSFYGLTADSDFALHPFEGASASEADLRIRRGRVSAEPASWSDRGVCWAASPERFWLDVAGVARYEVVGDGEIIVDPHPQADDQRVVDFLTDRPLAVLLARRGLWALLGTAVARGNGALLLSSPVPGLAFRTARGLETEGATVLSGRWTLVRPVEGGALAVVEDPPTALVPTSCGRERLARHRLVDGRPSLLPLVGAVELGGTTVLPSGLTPVLGVQGFSMVCHLLVVRAFLDGLGLRPPVFAALMGAIRGLRLLRCGSLGAELDSEAFAEALRRELA